MLAYVPPSSPRPKPTYEGLFEAFAIVLFSVALIVVGYGMFIAPSKKTVQLVPRVQELNAAHARYCALATADYALEIKPDLSRMLAKVDSTKGIQGVLSAYYDQCMEFVVKRADISPF